MKVYILSPNITKGIKAKTYFFTKNSILFFFFFSLSNFSFSQKENDIWYFGDQAGLDFNGGVPIALTNGSLSTYDNCISVADCKGNLLFYCNGVNIWNRNHAVMPNGSGLLGNTSAGNSAYAVKQPGNNNSYYLFTINAFTDPTTLRFSIIDMNLQGGAGDITVVKNIALINQSSEKITAIRHENNHDIWIIAHPWNNNSFYSYLLSENGLDTVPVKSTIGLMLNLDASSGSGQITASKSGNKIACANYYFGVYELFDFDRILGTLSNLITISGYSGAWGAEFSSDESKLYVTQWTFSDIIQFDISSGVQSTIINSATSIGTVTSPNSQYKAGYLQIGPDNKIYVAKYESNYLGVINFPNNSGTSCNFIDNGVFLSTKKSLAGLPSYFLTPATFSIFPPTDTICSGAQVILSSNGATTYSWSPSVGLNVTDNDTVIASPNTTTTYKAVGTNPGGCKDSLEITVTVQSSAKSDFNFTSSCKTIRFINNSTLATDYLWDFGDGYTSSELNPVHVYADTGNFKVMLVAKSLTCSNDTSYQSFTISTQIKAQFSTTLDTCSSIVNFINLSPTADTYFWDFGDGDTSNLENPSHFYSSPGLFSITYIPRNGLCSSDSVKQTVAITIPVNLSLLSPTDSICPGEQITLTASGATSYTWSPSVGLNVTKGDTVVASPISTTQYKVIGTGNAGCKDSLEIMVNVLPSAKSSFTYDSSCTTIYFTMDSSSGKLFFWDFGDGITDTITINPVHIYADSGNYKVMLVAKSQTCGNDTSYQTINITEKIKAQFSYTIDTCTTTLNFINLSPAANTFLWNFGDSNTSNAKNPTHPYTAPGNYSVMFFINQGTPCKDSIQQNVILDSEWLNENISIPNVFTPNGDGYNDKFEIRSNRFCKIYSAKIFNRWGKLIIDIIDATKPWDGSVDGNAIQAGVYYMFVLNEDKVIHSGMLTVVK